MLFTSSMMTTVIIISMMQMMSPHSVLVPVLLGKALALKYALFVVPKVAIGAVLFGQGAALIGGRLLWQYLHLKRLHPRYRHRRPHPHYHGPPLFHHHGWSGPGQTLGPILHQKYNAAYDRGHRAIDFLTWGLDKASWGARYVGDRIGEKAVKALYLASELSKPSYGVPIHHHVPHTYAHGHAYEHPPFEHIVAHGPPVKEIIEHGPHGTVFHSSDGGPISHGPEYFHSDPSGSHSISPTQSVLVDDHGDEPKSVYESSYGPPEEDGPYSSYGDGGESAEYSSSSFDDAVGRGYSGGGYHSDIGPEYVAEGSSVPANSVPLDRDEFLKLLDWVGSDEYQGKASNAHESYQSNERFTTAPVDPIDVQSARVVRIKRDGEIQAQEAKITQKKADSYLKYIVEDVRRFFTIIAYLDDSKCLQKLVCDVHAKAKGLKPDKESTITAYETHIISAFRVLESFMPSTEDSSTNYRVAARLGLTAPSGVKFCNTYYDSCTYSAQDIIGFNHKVETNQIEDIKITKGVDVQAQLEALEKQNKEAGTIGEGEAVGTTSSTTTTTEEPAFPKV